MTCLRYSLTDLAHLPGDLLDEMRKGGVDWQVVSYGGAVPSFTNPAAGNDKTKGAAYNEKADRRSWKAMQQFFAEIFAR